MLTTFDLDEYVYDALGAGASGFLLKDVAGREAVRRRARGGGRRRAARPGRDPPADRRVRAPAAAPAPAERSSELTPRETEVLRLVAEGLSNAEIAEPARGQRRDRQDPRQPRARRSSACATARRRSSLAYESGLVRPAHPSQGTIGRCGVARSSTSAFPGPRCAEAAGEDRVCLIPVATLEDHGPPPADRRRPPHRRRGLPARAAAAAPDEIVLLPAHPARLLAAPHGLPRPHHDRAGTRSPATVADVGTRRSRATGSAGMLLPQRPRVEPELRSRLAARLVGRRAPRRLVAAAAFYLAEPGRRSPGDRRGCATPSAAAWRHACELGYLHLPRHRPGRRRHGRAPSTSAVVPRTAEHACVRLDGRAR